MPPLLVAFLYLLSSLISRLMAHGAWRLLVAHGFFVFVSFSAQGSWHKAHGVFLSPTASFVFSSTINYKPTINSQLSFFLPTAHGASSHCGVFAFIFSCFLHKAQGTRLTASFVTSIQSLSFRAPCFSLIPLSVGISLSAIRSFTKNIHRSKEIASQCSQ